MFWRCLVRLSFEKNNFLYFLRIFLIKHTNKIFDIIDGRRTFYLLNENYTIKKRYISIKQNKQACTRNEISWQVQKIYFILTSTKMPRFMAVACKELNKNIKTFNYKIMLRILCYKRKKNNTNKFLSIVSTPLKLNVSHNLTKL